MNDILRRIWEKKFAFLGTFFLVFTLTYIIFLAIDFLPEAPMNEESTKSIDSINNKSSQNDDGPILELAEVDESQLVTELDNAPKFPVKISIAKLDKNISVLNPSSRTIADLDAALLNGVVRHPDSATLTQEGNVFILGHSSYLPNVFNSNFQAFNGIQNLEWGDTIDVYSEDSVYEYRVEKVYRAKAKDVTVPIAGTGHLLTLATCNSFGSTDDRYIVEAKQVDVRKL